MTLWEEICRTSVAASFLVGVASSVSAAPGFASAHAFVRPAPLVVGHGHGTSQPGRIVDRHGSSGRSFRHGGAGVGGVIVPILPYGPVDDGPDVEAHQDSRQDSRQFSDVERNADGPVGERWVGRDAYALACMHPLIIEVFPPKRRPAVAPPRIIYGSPLPVCGQRS